MPTVVIPFRQIIARKLHDQLMKTPQGRALLSRTTVSSLSEDGDCNGFFSECCGCCAGSLNCSCFPFTAPPTPMYGNVTSTCGMAFETSSTIQLNQTLIGDCWEQTSNGDAGMPPAIDIILVCCSGDIWTATLQMIPAGCVISPTASSTGTCSPFSVTFVFTLPASGCCEPSGGTVTLTVMG